MTQYGPEFFRKFADLLSEQGSQAEASPIDEDGSRFGGPPPIIVDPDIPKELRKKGYQLLGRGREKLAFLEPETGQVLLIISKSAKDQVGFTTWVQYCQRNPSNPFLPRYQGVAPFEFKGERYIQARMEPLTHGDKSIRTAVARLGSYIVHADPNTLEDFSKDYHKEYALLAQTFNQQELQSLHQALQSVVQLAKQNRWSWDLDQSNIMFRGKTPIMLDPYFAEMIWDYY